MAEMGIPTFNHAGQYALVDLWERDWPQWATRGVEWLLKQNLKVILAHPERMAALRQNPKFIDELARMGLLFQGNLGPIIAGGDKPEVVALAHQFLKDGRYFMVGTDGHRPDTPCPSAWKVCKPSKNSSAPKSSLKLTQTNPEKLWESTRFVL